LVKIIFFKEAVVVIGVKKKKALLAMLAVLVAGTMALTGCGSSSSKPAAGKDGKLVIAQSSDPLFLDPHGNDEGPTNSVNSNIYDSLVDRQGDLTIKPGLAESWEQKDSLTWVFHLRKNVKFHNGDPFTADDVLFSFEHVAKNKVVANMVNFIDKTTKVDDYTIEIKTKEPFAPMLNYISKIMIIDKKYVEAVGDQEFNLKPIGTGPYKVTEWVKEDHINMVANDEYWKGKPEIKNVVFRPITNEATRTAALISGDVQLITDVPVRDADRIQKDSKLQFQGVSGLRFIYLTVDVTRPVTPAVEGGKNPFVDERVRKALRMSIDTDSIIKNVMNGHAYPANQGNPKVVTGYVEDLENYKYDPEQAKKLLAEAGYPEGFSLTLDAPNNRYHNDFKVAEAIASQLAKVGINVKLNLMPKSLYFDYIRPGDKTTMCLTGWSSTEGDAGDWYVSMFYTRGLKPGHGASNRGFYSNPEFDKLCDDADATADMAQRTKYLQDATRLLAKEMPFVPLYFQEDSYGFSKKLDFKPRIDEYVYVYDIHYKK
jgi:peptide/nickel transport system substrate-binding protein